MTLMNSYCDNLCRTAGASVSNSGSPCSDSAGSGTQKLFVSSCDPLTRAIGSRYGALFSESWRSSAAWALGLAEL